MPRALTIILCLLASFQTDSHSMAQDVRTPATARSRSLSDRLRDAKHIGLSVDEKMAGFTLHVYTSTQQNKNRVALAEYRVKYSEYQSGLESFDKKSREAQQRGASTNELNAITNARNSFTSTAPYSSFSNQIALYDVVFVGGDYLEVAGSNSPDSGTILIPLSKICRILLPKKPADTDTSDTDTSDSLDQKRTK